MNLRDLALTVFFLGVAPSPTLAQNRVRPNERAPSLQEAIYTAENGATIEAWRYLPRIQRESIVIDRPLTLIGAYCEIDCGPSFVLAGPGFGRVTLVRAHVTPASTPECGYWSGTPAITATGFEEVRLVDCYIQGRDAYFYSGVSGGSAVEASDIERLVLERSELHAGQSAWYPDYTCSTVAWPAAAPGVSAPNTLVIAEDSLFFGGAGGRFCFDDSSGRCGDAPWQTDAGAPGLVADRLFFARCTFIGGTGCSWTNRPEVGATGTSFEASFAEDFGEPAGYFR